MPEEEKKQLIESLMAVNTALQHIRRADARRMDEAAKAQAVFDPVVTHWAVTAEKYIHDVLQPLLSTNKQS